MFVYAFVQVLMMHCVHACILIYPHHAYSAYIYPSDELCLCMHSAYSARTFAQTMHCVYAYILIYPDYAYYAYVYPMMIYVYTCILCTYIYPDDALCLCMHTLHIHLPRWCIMSMHAYSAHTFTQMIHYIYACILCRYIYQNDALCLCMHTLHIHIPRWYIMSMHAYFAYTFTQTMHYVCAYILIYPDHALCLYMHTLHILTQMMHYVYACILCIYIYLDANWDDYGVLLAYKVGQASESVMNFDENANYLLCLLRAAVMLHMRL